MSLSPGQSAPDFRLYNTNKEEVSLRDYAGKPVVLLFFPMAFTSVCTAELCAVRDAMATYNELNAEVLGISVDSLFTLKRFQDEQQLNFPLLSDFNKEVSQAYGAYYETFAFGMKGVSKRSAFVVDPGGVIRYAEILENAGDQPNLSAVQQTLSSL